MAGDESPLERELRLAAEQRDDRSAGAACFTALCGYDAEHTHGPDCTTDCPCGRGTINLGDGSGR